MFKVLFLLVSFVCAALSVFLLWDLLPQMLDEIYETLSRPSLKADAGAAAGMQLSQNWVYPVETFMLGPACVAWVIWHLVHTSARLCNGARGRCTGRRAGATGCTMRIGPKNEFPCGGHGLAHAS